MKPQQHYGYFKNGKLHAESFTSALRALKGVALVLTVAEFKETRTSPQNRYYHGVVVYLIHRALEEAGWEITHEGTHEMLKYRFLREERPIGNDGEFVTTIRSTTDLNTQEFGEYLEHCIRFAAEYLNVEIPQPMEQQEMKLETPA